LHEFGHSLHYLFDYKKMLFSNWAHKFWVHKKGVLGC
jgi:hypothetical protein